LVGHIREEIGRLREAQLRNIDKGFGELIRRLEEKRDELKAEFAGKYKSEEDKLLARAAVLEQN
jgi:ABC-type phosphate transport system auxiliary subunit